MVKTKSPFTKRKWSFDIMMLAYGVIIVGVLAIAGQLWAMRSRMMQVIPTDTYQAVFLTNGQVYFGKLNNLNSEYMVLKDVYYIQQSTDDTSDEAATTDDESENTQLKIIRLGEEIHQPQNGMIIARDHMMYWENLRADSRIIDAINQEKQHTVTE
ncbi:MAG: hypothetical protein KIH62_004850 [Candidatus Kerfeldbacteria bacterium]|nr:hypothetical protein [Candidatus Kerfeldbacteria bacterium]